MIPFLAGLFIGVLIGLVGAALFRAARIGDEMAERIVGEKVDTEVHYLSDNLKRRSVKENQ